MFLPSRFDRTAIKRRLPYWGLRLRRLWNGSAPPLRELVRDCLPDNPVIIEAGANNGSSTIELSKSWPRGTVHAFEPVPSCYQQLEMHVRGLRNVRTYNLGLSDVSGTRAMAVSSNNGLSSSLLRPKLHLTSHPSVRFPGTIEIPTLSLDDWSVSYGVPSVDVLWLDLQGYEPDVLLASKRILPTVRIIQSEVNLIELYEGAVLYPAFRASLESLGFSVFREDLSNESGDVIFKRAESTRQPDLTPLSD